MYESINFVAIDFETATSKAACQVGIAVVRQGEIVEQICRYIQPPGNRYVRQAIAVHHITPDMTIDAPTFAELWPEIRKYFHCQLLVFHNSSFDLNILKKEMERYDLNAIRPMGIVDTYELTGYKLEEACTDYGIEIENHHNALSDAIACARLFIAYLTTDYIPEHIETESPKNKLNHSYNYAFKDYSMDYIAEREIRHDLLKQDLSHADPSSPFYDKKVVITGLFPIDRNELATFLKEKGADINTSSSKKTNIVLIGEDPGPKKLEKIQELKEEGFDIQTLTWGEIKEFL